jgi:cold shock CspA family protein
MAKSGQSFNKREKEKQRAKERQEKKEKMEERKANAKKGQALEDMLAYIDENGNLTSTPPDPSRRREISLEEIEIGVPKQLPPNPEDLIRKGVVSFYNSAKGFGFIRDLQTGTSAFFHDNDLTERLQEGDKVVFEETPGQKGPVAINIKREK